MSKRRVQSLLVLIALVFVCAAPMAASFATALVDAETGRLSVRPIVGMWGDALAWRLLARSLLISAAAAAVALAVGVPYAYLVSSTDLPWRTLWEVLGFSSVVIPSYVAAMAWLNMLGSSGWVGSLFAEGGTRSWGLYGVGGATAVLAAAAVPFVILFSSASFRTASEESSEAARVDGASALQIFLRIRLPAAMPGVLLGALAAFAMSMGDYEIPATLGVETIAWETISLHTAGRLDAALSVAAAPALIAMAAAAAYVLRYGGALNLEMPFAQGRARPQPLGRFRPLATAFVALVVAASLGVPLAGLIIGAGSVGAVLAAVGATSRQLAVTLSCAAGAATISVAAGTLVARAFRGPGGGAGARTAGAALAALPLAVPGATLALGLMALWNRPVLYEALLAVPTGLAVAVGIRFLFFGVASVLAASAAVPGEIEDAARADGAGPLRVLLSVWLPLALPAILGGALVVFALSVSELTVSHLLCPPGYQTLSEHLFDRLHTGEVERVSSVAIIMVSVAAAALCAGLLMLKRAARRL